MKKVLINILIISFLFEMFVSIINLYNIDLNEYFGFNGNVIVYNSNNFPNSNNWNIKQTSEIFQELATISMCDSTKAESEYRKSRNPYSEFRFKPYFSLQDTFYHETEGIYLFVNYSYSPISIMVCEHSSLYTELFDKPPEFV